MGLSAKAGVLSLWSAMTMPAASLTLLPQSSVVRRSKIVIERRKPLETKGIVFLR